MRFKLTEEISQTIEKIKQGKYDQLTPEEKAEIDREYQWFLKENPGEVDEIPTWRDWLISILGNLEEPRFHRPKLDKTDEFIRYAKRKGVGFK